MINIILISGGFMVGVGSIAYVVSNFFDNEETSNDSLAGLFMIAKISKYASLGTIGLGVIMIASPLFSSTLKYIIYSGIRLLR